MIIAVDSEGVIYNLRARFLLVSTSMAPILIAIAISTYESGGSLRNSILWILGGVLLVLLCFLLLHHAKRKAQVQTIRIATYKKSSQEVIAFLLAYLLPFLSTDSLSFNSRMITGAYVLVVIFTVIAHAGVFHFNPVLGIFKYHFYIIENDEGLSLTLITKLKLNRNVDTVRCVMLTEDILLVKE